MAARARLTVDSLGAAIEAFMNAPTARRSVVVASIEVAHSASLLAFLDLQGESDLWETVNGARLLELASIDRLFRAIVIDVLPVLVADPTSPTISLLSRYAVFIQSSAPAVGGDFEHRATLMCQDLIAYAENTRRHPLRLSAANLLRRLQTFRSETVTIADSDPDSYNDDGVLPGMMGLDPIHVNSFRRLASFREEVIDSPPAERRVTIDALPTSHADALLGVVYFEGWIVRNLARITALANVDVAFELIGHGLLPFLHNHPASQPALHFLNHYVLRVRDQVGAVGGEFVTHATVMCDNLIANCTRPLPPPEMRMSTERLRRDLEVFTSRDLSIHDSDSTDDSSDSTGESTSASSNASDSTGASDSTDAFDSTGESIHDSDSADDSSDASDSTGESTSPSSDASDSTGESAYASDSTDESTSDAA